MHHFSKIAAGLEERGLDAVLLTEEANRLYASGFRSAGTDGLALVTRRRNYYLTDSRYTEAAGRCIPDAELREAGRGKSYTALLRELIDGYLDGVTGVYHTPQGYFVDEAAAEAFDQNFPPKEKLKLPGQLF